MTPPEEENSILNDRSWWTFIFLKTSSFLKIINDLH